MRQCLIEPTPALFDAATLLSAAVDAHFNCDAEEAGRLYRQAGANNAPIVGDCVFNLCRSAMAVSLYKNTLDTLLTTIEDVQPPATVPWEFKIKYGSNPLGELEMWYSHASGYAFAACIAGKRESALVRKAVQALLAAQDANGSWSLNSCNPDADVATTAMAIHALAEARPNGWERASKRAVEWLWTVQTEAGSWTAKNSRLSAPHLTVLVLDAIELASGGTRTTLRTIPHGQQIEQGEQRKTPGKAEMPVPRPAESVEQTTNQPCGSDGWFRVAPSPDSPYRHGPVEATLKQLAKWSEMDQRTLSKHNGKSWVYIQILHGRKYALWCNSADRLIKIMRAKDLSAEPSRNDTK